LNRSSTGRKAKVRWGQTIRNLDHRHRAQKLPDIYARVVFSLIRRQISLVTITQFFRNGKNTKEELILRSDSPDAAVSRTIFGFWMS
jgi:hypothetical protein